MEIVIYLIAIEMYAYILVEFNSGILDRDISYDRLLMKTLNGAFSAGSSKQGNAFLAYVGSN